MPSPGWKAEMPRVIGITGGVGAGKSRILSVLESVYGAKILQADQVAAELEEPGQEGFRLLVEAFGTEILGDDGRLDRKAFAERIFQDQESLLKVNRIIHPLTIAELGSRIQESEAPVIAVEAALFDDESRRLCDELWLVDTSEENRVERLMENRGYSRKKCLDIMANQPSRAEFLNMADQVIDNNGTLEQVEEQIARLLV